MKTNKKKDPQRFEYAPEDFDVYCEVCGTKWDFIEDRYQCPNCGDTLNKVEIATLKEEAYIRRRKKELEQEKQEQEKQEKKDKVTKTIKMIIKLSILVVIGIYVYKHYSELKPILDNILAKLPKN